MTPAQLNEACSDIAAPGSPVVRDYSHSPSDCLDLIAAMVAKKWSLLVAGDTSWSAAFSNQLHSFDASGDTLQLAVCRAAVAAMEGK